MERKYEVIIVGAGPAGATLAYELARKGISVLLIEKEPLPRYKCCAGGLTFKAAQLLGADISEAVEREVSHATITFAGVTPYHNHNDKTIIYTVMRDRFDCALVNRAEKAGAVVLQKNRVNGIQLGDSGVDVITPAGDFSSQIIAGADGVSSVVARTLGLKNNASYLTAIETEVQVAEEELNGWKSQIAIGLGFIHHGYAWAFPKLDHLSIGIACPSSGAKVLQPAYRDFLHSLNFRSYSIARRGGGLIPVGKGKVIACRGRAVLLGDAAGLVDPLTGEGIYNAILSAQLAVPAIEQSLLHDKMCLQDYQKAVEEKIMPERKIAHFLAAVWVRFPFLVFKALQQDERMWRGCCYLLRGEISYATIKQKLGILRELFAVLS